jgi:hypothetical protein
VVDLKTSLCGRNFPELLLPFHLDQYLYDFSDHGRSDCTPWYTYIFSLVLRLVILGLAAMYAKSVQNVMSDRVRPAGSLPLHFWVIYNVFQPSQILL